MSESHSHPRVVIIGAGTAGIACAIALKDQLHFDNFTIYERSSSIGGTWSQSTYPGCSSDVAIHWYSLSTELNPNWTSYYAEQPEILAYWERIFKTHDLEIFTKFNTAVTSLEWNESEQQYRIMLEDSVTSVHQETTAEIVISAVGFFQDPIIPLDLTATVEKFQGPSWHSARWRHDVDLSGKLVGVIGNGCSGAQLIPQITQDPTVEVINFARSRQWFAPKPQHKYSDRAKWIFSNVPLAARMYRNMIMAGRDLNFMAFRDPQSFMSQIARKRLTKYLKSKAPPEYVDKLLPDFAPGCKRLIIDPGYLEALKRPNVHLRWDKIEAIVEDGIRLVGGEVIPLDVIVYATGYDIFKNRQIKVVGRNGQSLEKYWDEQGGPTAYLGTCFPDIPNYFMIAGPNVATGHASVIFSSETQIQYIMQMIKPILEAKARSFAVKAHPTIKYNEWLQGRLQNSVWSTCITWYHRSQSQKNVSIFPGPLTWYWWILRRPVWDDFIAEGANKWKRELARKRVVRRLLAFVTTVAVVGFGLMRQSPDLKKAVLEHIQGLVVLGSRTIKIQ